MGTWDAGLLDNDTACDGLHDVTSVLETEIEELGRGRTARAAERLAAAVGLLLQLDAYSFSPDSPESAEAIARAVAAHGKRFASWPAHPRRLLQQVATGKGHALAQRPAQVSRTLARILHTHPSPGGGFGRREPWLFVRPGSAAFVQRFARQCAEAVDDDFEDEDNWSDLCREGIGMGALAALLVIAPYRLPRAKVERWRRLAREGLARLEAEPDEELGFHREYYANLDRAFGQLLRKVR
jgi:hypothetical protein